jgi:hypothetical protein
MTPDLREGTHDLGVAHEARGERSDDDPGHDVADDRRESETDRDDGPDRCRDEGEREVDEEGWCFDDALPVRLSPGGR